MGSEMGLIKIAKQRAKKAALKPEVEMQPQQERVVAKMEQQPALLAYHALGSGKTLSSIAAGEQTEGPKAVVVPAALRENYRKELSKFTDQPEGAPDYDVRSYNKAVSKGLPQAGLTVFDEAHRMGRPGTKVSKLPTKAHGKVMFLTGTPVRNDPSEFVPMLKVLAQGRNPPGSHKSFRDKFVENVEVRPTWWQKTWHGVKPGMVERLRNQQELKRLVKGRVDYHPLEGDFPRVEEEDIEVEMTPEQTAMYEAFLNEDVGLAYKVKKNLPPSKAESAQLNAFLSAVRQLSNNPMPFDETMKGSAVAHSPKLRRMLGDLYKGLESDPNFKAVVYSNYLQSGILPLAEALEKKGVPHHVFTGGLKDSERREIVEDYNSGNVKILLVSGAGSEGLDLKGTKLMQLMEPHWNQSRLDQMTGRAVRHGSHAHLPEEERVVKVRRYFSNPKRGLMQRWGMVEKDTGADQYMSNLSETKQQLITQFLEVLKESSEEANRGLEIRKAAELLWDDTELPKSQDFLWELAEKITGLPTIEKKAALPYFKAQHLTNVEPDFYQMGKEFFRGNDPRGQIYGEAVADMDLANWKKSKLTDVPLGTELFSKGKQVGLQIPSSQKDVAGRIAPLLALFDVPEGDPEFARKSVASLREFAERAGHGLTPENTELAERLLHGHWKKQQGLLGAIRRNKLLTALAAVGVPVASYGGYKLLKKGEADYAPGLPDPKRFGDPRQIPHGEVLKWVVQRHLAQKAGPHYDVRLGREGGEPSLYSWATRKELPEPGKKIMLYQQPLHRGQYAEFEGNIEEGYGKGTVKKHDYGSVIVTKAERDKIQFVVTHKRFPEFYTMVRMSGPPSAAGARQRKQQGGAWLMINTTPVSAAKLLKGKPEEVGIKKLKYGVVPADKVEKLFDPNYMIQEKVDGASALYHLLGDRIEALSYRISKTGRPILYTYKIFGPGGAKVDIPKELQGTIVRGEVYGEREGKAVPVQELGGILNAALSNSLEKQKAQNVQMRNMLFDVVRWGKTPIEPGTLTGEERMQKLQELMKHLPDRQFRLPETARTPEEQKALYERIVSGEHPATYEGVVAWPAARPGRAIKVKPRPEHDVWIQNVFPGKGKYEGAAGGFDYSLSPTGPIVGKVGGGFDDATRRQMMDEAEDWKGRLARISAMEKFPSGAYRNPAFISLHHDYPLAKSGAILRKRALRRKLSCATKDSDEKKKPSS